MSCPEFIAQSMAIRTATHAAHLTAGTYAIHMALDSFYTDIVDLIDEYAEVYAGTLRPGADFSIPRRTPPAGSPTALLSDYLDLIRDEAKEAHETEALKNILAEIEALTLRTLYKLNRLK